jgi:hypothetical protein
VSPGVGTVLADDPQLDDPTRPGPPAAARRRRHRGRTPATARALPASRPALVAHGSAADRRLPAPPRPGRAAVDLLALLRPAPSATS